MDNDTERTPSSAIEPWRLMRVSLDALGARVFRWAALLMAFSLFAWTMARPDGYRLAAAFGFTVLCTLPLWWRREK